jgi:hypothetical protein
LQVSLANTAANGTAVKVDNSGVTQPVSGTVTANQGGTWTVTGAGGTFPIVTWGGGTLGAMANYGTSPGAVLVPGVNAFVTNTNANGQAAMASSSPVVIASNQSAVATAPAAGTNRIGYVSDDPCTQKTKTTAPFSTSSGGPVSIVALSGSTVVYVCSISAITDTAIKLSFIDGTGGSCASAQHAIWGSTTAANGMSLAANGGFTMGSGNGSVGVTAAASAFCLLQSGTSLVAGNITYVQQ